MDRCEPQSASQDAPGSIDDRVELFVFQRDPLVLAFMILAFLAILLLSAFFRDWRPYGQFLLRINPWFLSIGYPVSVLALILSTGDFFFSPPSWSTRRLERFFTILLSSLFAVLVLLAMPEDPLSPIQRPPSETRWIGLHGVTYHIRQTENSTQARFLTSGDSSYSLLQCETVISPLVVRDGSSPLEYMSPPGGEPISVSFDWNCMRIWSREVHDLAPRQDSN